MTLPELLVYSSDRWDVEDLMDDISAGAQAYYEKLEKFTDDISFLRDQDAIEKYAHAEAHKLVSEQAFDILMAETRKAIAETEEYNIEIFVNQLENAMIENEENLITMPVDEVPGRINVEIYENMVTYLGTAEQWITATNAAKGELGLGKITDNKIRSKIWKEIYKIDREGGKKIHPRTKDDITERYVGKYFATITERIKSLTGALAPFWYYIHHGNIPAETAEGENKSGEPYPKIEPTNFVFKAETSIKYAFYDAYVTIKEEAERVYSKYLQDDYGLQETHTFREAEEQITDISIDDLLGAVSKAETHQAVETVKVNNKWYDVIKTSGGNIGLRYNLQKNR